LFGIDLPAPGASRLGQAVPLDRESLPVHLVSQEKVADEKQVAQWIVEQPEWLKVYSPWLAAFNPDIWQEVLNVARNRGVKTPIPDLTPLIEYMGVKGILKQMGWKRFIDEGGIELLIAEAGTKKGIKELLAKLSPEQREELRRQLE
jgi:hypothetical protein